MAWLIGNNPGLIGILILSTVTINLMKMMMDYAVQITVTVLLKINAILVGIIHLTINKMSVYVLEMENKLLMMYANVPMEKF